MYAAIQCRKRITKYNLSQQYFRSRLLYKREQINNVNYIFNQFKFRNILHQVSLNHHLHIATNQNSLIHMLKRLALFVNTAENELAAALVDKTHQKIKFSCLRKIFKNLENEKYLGHILSALKKYFKSSSYTLRIKSLIVLHYFLRRTQFQNDRINTFAQIELNDIKDKKGDALIIMKSPIGKKKIQLENQQKQFVQKNIIEFYIVYLLKFIASQSAFLMAKQTLQKPNDIFGIAISKNHSKTLQTTSVTQMSTQTKLQVQGDTLMQHINNGFKILNLINFVIQSQQIFNKMGRYYNDHHEILNLFIMYLDDLTIYSDYIKKLSKCLTKSIKDIKEDQIKHCFLYLTQSQKTSDRLYEFYYNRYYYTKVKKLISMPTFLNIDNDDFEGIVKEIKKVDRELVTIVKESKYSQNYKMNNTHTCVTEPDTHHRTHSSTKMNKTLITSSLGSKKLNTINMTLQDLTSNNRNKNQQQQNIQRYLETFEDIFEDQQPQQQMVETDFI